MTDRDRHRVGQAVQGISFPADQRELVDYAADHGFDERIRAALEDLPPGRYGSTEEVERAAPRRPGRSG